MLFADDMIEIKMHAPRITIAVLPPRHVNAVNAYAVTQTLSPILISVWQKEMVQLFVLRRILLEPNLTLP